MKRKYLQLILMVILALSLLNQSKTGLRAEENNDFSFTLEDLQLIQAITSNYTLLSNKVELYKKAADVQSNTITIYQSMLSNCINNQSSSSPSSFLIYITLILTNLVLIINLIL